MKFLIRETVRNLRANAGRSVLLATVLAVSVAFPVGLDLAETTEALALEADLVTAGRYIAIASSEEGVAMETCHLLRSHPGVVTTASFELIGPSELSSVPGRPYQRSASMTGSVDLWGGLRSARPGSLWLGEKVIEDLGGTTPGLLMIRPENTARSVAGVVASHRNEVLERWLLVTVMPVGAAAECWVEWTPAAYRAGRDSMGTIFARDDVVTRERLSLDEFDADPSQLVLDRTAETAWMIVTAAVMLVGWIVHRARRADYALYRALGVRLSDLFFMAQIEVLVLLMLTAPTGAALAVAIQTALTSPPTASQLSLALTLGGMSAATLLVLIPLGLLAMPWDGLAASLRDR